MTPLEEELAGVAGEYALGLLTGEERDRFERRMMSDTRLRGLVDDWQRRLQPLVTAIDAVVPGANVWQRIEASLEAPHALRQQRPSRRPSRRIRWWQRVGLWRGWALGATAVAAALAVVVVLREPPPAGPRLIAVLHTTATQAGGPQPAVLFTTQPQGSGFTAREIEDISQGPSAHELWLLPDANTKPISLGLLTPDETTHRGLPAAAVQGLKPGAAVAISEEPQGGSPTGQPTGPVVYIGTLIEDEG